MITTMIGEGIVPVIGAMIGDDIGGGGISPVLPSGYTGRYLSYYPEDIQTVTGDDVEQWDDRSDFGNDLTQTTAGNRYLFIENNILTQTNSSTQPLLVDTGGEGLAIRLDSAKYLSGMSPPSSDFTIIHKFINTANSTTVIRKLNTGPFLGIFKNSTTNVRFFADDFTEVSLTTPASEFDDLQTLAFKKDGNTLSVYLNGVFGSSQDVTGKTYETLTDWGWNSAGGYIVDHYEASQYSRALTDSEILNYSSTRPSDYVDLFIPSLTSVPSGLNNKIPKMYSESHNQFENVLRSDAVNDYMEGIQPEAGEFALVFRKKCNTLGTVKTLFSSSTTSAEIRTNVSDQIEVLADDGTVFTYTLSTVLNEQQTTIFQLNGTDLELYESSTLLQSLDVTGKTFTIDRSGKGTASSDSDWQEITTYPNYLTQSSIDYFYYLKNSQNEILLPPIALA